MSGIALVLGPIAFTDFEIPSVVTFGGSQRLFVHRLMNGHRVIDALGPDEADITFSGVFSGPSAMSRVRVIDSLRVQGNAVPLTWDTLRYTTIVRIFEADYRNPYWIPYRVSCTVLRSPATVDIVDSVTIPEVVQSDISAAVGFQEAAGVSLSEVQYALGQPSATIFGTSTYGELLTNISSSRSSIDAIIGSTETPLLALMDSFGVSATNAASDYLSAVAGAQRLAALALTQAYLGRAARNSGVQG